MSIIRDPDAYERFEQVVLVHGARFINDLAYADYIQNQLPEHEYLGEQIRAQLKYYPTVTREPFRNRGRITELLKSGKLCADLGLPDLDPEHDRVMICGSPSMLDDTVGELESRGFREGSSHDAAEYTIERAFAER
jgi:ferredoxin--NADP+ reductase